METFNNSISGKRYTFYQLIKDYHIQIPIIQRDYAQGRSGAIEIRNDFLDALFNYLDENKPNRDLDFIYGNQSDEVIEDDVVRFIPLDGQQRLTTLFLLHWYLANKDGEDEVEELKKHLVYNRDTDNPISKFSYETRTSSREFCDAILINNIDLDKLLIADKDKKNSLSKTIKDSAWYFLSWGTDPTIQSMMVMLDAIHYRFKDKNGFFSRLISIENPVITFQFLDLKEFNLTDDLYIKMNARGIPLTPFENFKAKFEQFIKNSNFNSEKYKLDFNGSLKSVDVKTYFSHKIDTKWANLFWKYTGENKKKYDELIMNFIRATAVNHYAGLSKTENLKYLIDKKNESISFQQYIKFNCFDEKYITDLITILDLIKNGNNKVKEYLIDYYYYNEEVIFETVIKNNFIQAGYTERVQFHAYSQYLIKWGTELGLHNWMRVIHNLSLNTIYNNETDFINSIKSINNLLVESNRILVYLSENGKIDGFDKFQIIEEKIKSNLILKSEGDEWKTLIYAIEQHGYFKGQIGFLLYMCGITSYFEEFENCGWNHADNIIFQLAFVAYCEKSKKIFDNDGLKIFDDFIWERALLSKSDYLISEGRNQSFLINNDRDISWKRFLKGDKNTKHQKLIKEVFDEIEVPNIDKSLVLIKEKNESQVHDWRLKFINQPNLFNYLGAKRYVRKESTHGFVLFSGERMSGGHAELFSYSFYLENIHNKSFNPFKYRDYYFAGGDDINERPCAYIDNWTYNGSNYAIDIFYSREKLKFGLRFFYRGIGDYNEVLIEILENNGFKLVDNSYLLLLNENEILSSINSLCLSFKKLIENNVEQKVEVI